MIPSAYITEWRKNAPWAEAYQVEQDLVISKALVQIYSDPNLKNAFAFRGGTSLQKIFFKEPTRYSEDIDLVQIKKENIGDSINTLRKILDPWLGKPNRDFKEGRVVLRYSFLSEETHPRKMRLKIEINNAEHICLLGLKKIPFTVDSTWFTGKAEIITYEIEEILGTKLRALYQRKKGRDLYDMAMAFNKFSSLNDKKIVDCFLEYMKHEDNKVSRSEYEQNLYEKIQDSSFKEDIQPLLKPGSATFEIKQASDELHKRLLALLPGDPWKRPQEKKKK